MYTIIPAKDEHLSQIAPLIAKTGYYNIGLQNNSLGLTPLDFLTKIVAKYYLPITLIAIDDNNQVLGIIIADTTMKIDQLPDWSCHIDCEIAKLFDNLFTFKIPKSFHIIAFSVIQNMRSSGIGKALMLHIIEKAKKAEYNTISLITVNCQTSAIKFYLNMGMMIVKTITVSSKIPYNEMLYLELKPNLCHNYFDTTEHDKLVIERTENANLQ